MSDNIFGTLVNIDKMATAAWYDKSDCWSCTCSHCQNFLVLARRRALPEPVLKILYSLGISPEKATYVCEISPVKDGHLYEFSYRIAGNIVSACSAKEDWGDICCWHNAYPYGAPGFPEPNFDLEFCIPLPWVLEKSSDGL